METLTGATMPATAIGIEAVPLAARPDLVARAAKGDTAAFDAIAARCGDALYRRAVAILREEADARDATQDALVRAWRELPRLSEAERFDAWLDRILVNVCRDQLRRRDRRVVREIRPPTDGGDDAAFRRLSVDDRTLLVLHHLERRSVADLAAVLAIPPGTVMRRLHTARVRLQAALDEEYRR
jgi:RNA polymerase sigma-70 factor (ECF subfamily)